MLRRRARWGVTATCWSLVWVASACGSRSGLESFGADVGSGGLTTGGGSIGAGGRASGAGGRVNGGGGRVNGGGGRASGGRGGFGGSTGGTSVGGVGGTSGSGGVAVCGDGVRHDDEHCDDGNDVTGDGCWECQRVVRLAAGQDHVCALDSAGRVKCWGGHDWGGIGLGDLERRGDNPGELAALPALDLGTGRRAVSVFAGAGHSCAILDDRSLKCWGTNFRGELGLGDENHRGDEPNEMGDALPTVDLGTGRHAVDMALGLEHTCALLDDGCVKCWGENWFGQLGLSGPDAVGMLPGEMGDALPAVDVGAGVVVGLHAGKAHTCALFQDGRLKCWGYNGRGELGLGDKVDRGRDPSTMGEHLPFVDFGSVRVLAVAGGMDHTCGFLGDGTLKCWGANVGQLGLGDRLDRGGEPGHSGASLAPVSLGTARFAVEVAGGWRHTCARLDDGTVKCWGENAFGQLGVGSKQEHGSGPGQMGDQLPRVRLGTGRRAVQLVAGRQFSCALLDDATVKCWGDGEQGQLGQGNPRPRGTRPEDMGDALPTVLVP